MSEQQEQEDRVERREQTKQSEATRQQLVLTGGIIERSVAALLQAAREFGYSTVLVTLVLGVVLWQGWLMVDRLTNDLKSEQAYTRETLSELAKESIQAASTSAKVVEENTEQGEKVETAIKSNTRMLGRVLEELKETPESIE